jgi:hypothetical protein
MPPRSGSVTGLWMMITFVVVFALGALTQEMFGREGETLLLKVPGQILRWARRRASAEYRDELYKEWLGVLDEAADDLKGRPVSELLFGLRFAVGVLYAAPIITRERERAAAELTKQRIGQAMDLYAIMLRQYQTLLRLHKLLDNIPVIDGFDYLLDTRQRVSDAARRAGHPDAEADLNRWEKLVTFSLAASWDEYRSRHAGYFD